MIRRMLTAVAALALVFSTAGECKDDPCANGPKNPTCQPGNSPTPPPPWRT